jgi:hypothetical protein
LVLALYGISTELGTNSDNNLIRASVCLAIWF